MAVRILHFADHLDGRIDGVFRHIISILETTSNEYQHLLCFQGNEYIEKKTKGVGGKIVIIHSITRRFSLKVFYEFYKIVKVEKIDIIHCHFLKPYIIAAFCNIFLKRKVLYNYHGIFIENEFYNIIEKTIYRIAHFLATKFHGVQLAITPTETCRKILLAETKLFPIVKSYYNAINVSSIYCEVDRSIINKIKAVKGFRIIFVGRIVHQKRLDLALSILRNLLEENSDVHLFVMGIGNQLENMKFYVYQLDLGTKVTFLGYVKEPLLYYQEFDTLLLPSEYEGMPFTILEAMSTGLPIVASNIDGVTEIINENNCGLLFSKGNVSEGTIKMNELINNYEKRKFLGTNGEKAIKEKYSAAEFGKQIRNIYSFVNSI